MSSQTCFTADELRARLNKKAGDIAMLPAVAIEALQIAKDPECSLNQLSSVIEKDVKLTTELLSMSNSVVFGASAPVMDIRQAIIRLGLNQTQNLLLTSGTASLMRKLPLEQEWVREVLWQHSFRTAKVATTLNRELKLGFEGEEFSSALLHDFGRLLLAVAAPEAFPTVDRLAFDDNEENLANENAHFGTDHCQFGAWFAEQNNLPRSIVASIEMHHLPESHHPDSKLIALVAAADHMANYYQREEERAGYDEGLNRGAHVLSNFGHPQIVKNHDGIVDHILDVVLPEFSTP